MWKLSLHFKSQNIKSIEGQKTGSNVSNQRLKAKEPSDSEKVKDQYILTQKIIKWKAVSKVRANGKDKKTTQYSFMYFESLSCLKFCLQALFCIQLFLLAHLSTIPQFILTRYKNPIFFVAPTAVAHPKNYHVAQRVYVTSAHVWNSKKAKILFCPFWQIQRNYRRNRASANARLPQPHFNTFSRMSKQTCGMAVDRPCGN